MGRAWHTSSGGLFWCGVSQSPWWLRGRLFIEPHGLGIVVEGPLDRSQVLEALCGSTRSGRSSP